MISRDELAAAVIRDALFLRVPDDPQGARVQLGGSPPDLPDLLPPVEEPAAPEASPVADAPEAAPPAEPDTPADADPPLVAAG
jgi:hypothetical protein